MQRGNLILVFFIQNSLMRSLSKYFADTFYLSHVDARRRQAVDVKLIIVFV